MTGQYTIDLVISREDVKVIKEQFKEFLEESEGFTLTVITDSGVNPSPELNDTIKKIFFNLIMTIHFGNFKGVN